MNSSNNLTVSFRSTGDIIQLLSIHETYVREHLASANFFNIYVFFHLRSIA